MLHMLSFFDLAEGVDLAAFEASLAPFSEHMIDAGLMHSRGAVGRRWTDTEMDTDAGRGQQWFFVSTFVDKAQCDRAYAYVADATEPCASLHRAVRAKMVNGVFSCWEDSTGH